MEVLRQESGGNSGAKGAQMREACVLGRWRDLAADALEAML